MGSFLPFRFPPQLQLVYLESLLFFNRGGGFVIPFDFDHFSFHSGSSVAGSPGHKPEVSEQLAHWSASTSSATDASNDRFLEDDDEDDAAGAEAEDGAAAAAPPATPLVGRTHVVTFLSSLLYQ